MNMIKVLMDTTTLTGGHSSRGIGTYTRLLTNELEKLPELKVVRSVDKSPDNSKDIDLVHYPYFDLFIDSLPLNPLKNKIVTIHDLIPLKFPEFYKPGVKGNLKFRKQKIALKTVKAVITDSQASKEDIIQHLSVPIDKIHVVYLAANPELSYQDEAIISKVKKKNKLPDKYILYVGDINYNKNIPQLIKSLKFLPEEISLVCLGRNFKKQDIPEWKWIENQIALSDVSERVVFLSDILTDSYIQLSAIYSGAIAYIQPSIYEGFGLPVLEAMKCKVPVVSARNSSLIEVGAESVVFSDTTAESIAAGIEKVLSWNKKTRDNFVGKAFEWGESFSWTKTAQETLEVYKQVSNK